jgi:amidase
VSVPTPSSEQVKAIAEQLGFDVNADEVEVYRDKFATSLFVYERIDQLPDYLPAVRYPRTPGRRPSPQENPYGAWYVKTEISGAPAGTLKGKRVVLKDTICLAGVPMMDGASVLEGYVPETDATVATRILDAGGEIVGKATCEYFSFSSAGHTSVTGRVESPLKPGYSPGGSSTGSAVLVVLGEADMALGGDQAGSIRIPSAACGIYGLKPTWGLVPYTGIISSEYNIDHAGPMTGDVADNALLLEAIAGPDGIDTRHATPNPLVHPYTEALETGAEGLRLALVEDGFGWGTSMPEVDATVREAAKRFETLGATVETVSFPWHRDAFVAWMAFAFEGYYTNLLVGNGFGVNHGGLYLTSLNDKLAGWRGRANELPYNLRFGAIAGQYMKDTTQGHYYGRAQNLARQARAAYDDLLSRHDLLLMPTVPQKARPYPDEIGIAETIELAFENIENTCPFNLTHHPAMSIPCGIVDGCPIGMMLIGRHYDEPTIYRAAYAFEQGVDWRSMGVGADA